MANAPCRCLVLLARACAHVFLVCGDVTALFAISREACLSNVQRSKEEYGSGACGYGGCGRAARDAGCVAAVLLACAWLVVLPVLGAGLQRGVRRVRWVRCCSAACMCVVGRTACAGRGVAAWCAQGPAVRAARVLYCHMCVCVWMLRRAPRSGVLVRGAHARVEVLAVFARAEGLLPFQRRCVLCVQLRCAGVRVATLVVCMRVRTRALPRR